jgi:hypothetical protein
VAGGLHEYRYLEGGAKVLIFIFPNEKDAFILEGAYVLGSLYLLSPQLSEKRSIDSRQHSAISYQQKN